MLAGLFLSKFDREGLKCLGFSNFSEAYNAMGYALGGKPTSIKNYMQEFDPLFPKTTTRQKVPPRWKTVNAASVSVDQYPSVGYPETVA